MNTENCVNLLLDQHRRIGIKDVICLLKGLRSQAVIKIIETSETTKTVEEIYINDENGKNAKNNFSTQCSNKKSSLVKGNTNLPQIRELNEIATLLRSMDMQKKQLTS